MGSITYLANKILDESDWKLGTTNDTIIQTKEEPLYEIVLNCDLEATNMQNTSDKVHPKNGDKIYAFYNIICRVPVFRNTAEAFLSRELLLVLFANLFCPRHGAKCFTWVIFNFIRHYYR